MIGSGPIVIGQACEFDYAGCQALKVLREDGYRTIVVNSNPTTIMTDPGFADRTYIEPLDLEGVAVSSGAACSSGKVQPSHVLAAMGVPPQLARGAIRVSLGPTTTESEVDRFVAAWIKVSGALLKESQGIAA